MSALELVAVSKQHGTGPAAVHALRGLSLALPRGSFTAVMGPSGSGKSTFLHCAAGLDTPTSGAVRVGGTDLTALSPRALTRFRRDRVGFVFQAYNLLPQLTVAQNVALPALLAGARPDTARHDALLDAVGLAGMQHRSPAQLSGGQAQRVAVARALSTDPEVLFADEPTGALDSAASAQVMALLRETSTRSGQTVVVVTHDAAVAAAADRVLLLRDGQLAGSVGGGDAVAVADRLAALAAPPIPSPSTAQGR